MPDANRTAMEPARFDAMLSTQPVNYRPLYGRPASRKSPILATPSREWANSRSRQISLMMLMAGSRLRRWSVASSITPWLLSPTSPRKGHVRSERELDAAFAPRGQPFPNSLSQCCDQILVHGSVHSFLRPAGIAAHQHAQCCEISSNRL